MVNETLLYAAAGLAVTEVTGITDFTGAGGDGGGGVGRPQVPGLGNIRFPDFPDVAAPNVSGFADAQARMAEAFAGMQQTALETQSPIEVPTVPEVPQVTNPFDQVEWPEFPAEFTDQFPDVPGVPDGDGPGPGGSGGYGAPSAWELLTTERAREGLPTVLGTDPSEFMAGEGLLGRSYQLGQATGGGINTARSAYRSADQRYRESTAGARSAVQSAQTATRPWEWDIDRDTAVNLATPFNTQGLPDVPSPVGTAAAAGDSNRIRNTGGADPSGGTPSPQEVEAVAAERSEEKKERLKEIPTAGSAGGTYV